MFKHLKSVVTNHPRYCQGLRCLKRTMPKKNLLMRITGSLLYVAMLLCGGCSSGNSGANTDSPDFNFSLISKNEIGVIGNFESTDPVISGNNTFVAFISSADNLVLEKSDGETDIFIYDIEFQSLSRVPFDHESYGRGTLKNLSLSADGRLVAFEHVTQYPEEFHHVFIYDRMLDQMDMIPEHMPTGPQGSDTSYTYKGYTNPHISGDGRFLAFYSFYQSFFITAPTSGEIVILNLQTQTRTVIPISTNGDPDYGATYHDNDIVHPTLNDNGRFLAFESNAPDLVANDQNGLRDIFIYDALEETLARVSINSQGDETIPFTYCVTGSDCVAAKPKGHSKMPSISADGRYVVFASTAKNLAGDPGICTGTCFQCRECLADDIFLRDCETNTTIAISAGLNGELANGSSFDPIISKDGAYVVFASAATNLVPDDLNEQIDIFLFEIATEELHLISRDKFGNQANGESRNPALGYNESLIVFQSNASNLPENGSNDFYQIILGRNTISN